MKITRTDIYMNEWAYAHHSRAETWRNAIWSVKHIKSYYETGQKPLNALLSAFRENMRHDRKEAIKAVIRAKEAQP